MELLEALLSYCDVDKDGTIDYQEFSNFLNWKEETTLDLLKLAKDNKKMEKEVMNCAST